MVKVIEAKQRVEYHGMGRDPAHGVMVPNCETNARNWSKIS